MLLAAPSMQRIDGAPSVNWLAGAVALLIALTNAPTDPVWRTLNAGAASTP